MSKRPKSIAKHLYKFHEGITKLAVLRSGVPLENILWSKRISGIDTDIAIYNGDDIPVSVIQVRHSGSAKEQEKKFWREMHELVEIKSGVSYDITMVSVIFDDNVKEHLYQIEQSIFDAAIRIPERPYGKRLISIAHQVTRSRLLNISKEAAYALLERFVDPDSEDFDPELGRLFESYSLDIEVALTADKPELISLWRGARESLHRQIDESAVSTDVTSIKRGLAKFLIFEEQFRKDVIASVINNRPLEDAPAYAAQLGSTRTFSTFHRSIEMVADVDVVSAIRTLGHTAETAIQNAPLDRMESQYLEPIRELATSSELLDAIIAHTSELADAGYMRALLDRCYSDPVGAASSIGATTRSSRHWLVDGIMTLARLASDLNQGYGYPELAADCGVPEFATLPGLTISQYCSRSRNLPNKQVDALAVGLSRRLSTLNFSSLDSPQQRALEQAFHILETRLVPYREFDPIGTIIRQRLEPLVGVNIVHVQRQKTALSEYAHVNAATTKVLLIVCGTASPIAVMWQSPNKNPRDKQKEFCARVAMLRMTWQQDIGSFVKRPLGPYVFVADGSWTLEQKRQLARFGFDLVLVPSQLDQLEALVVSSLNDGSD